jgi:hypothetical protein
MSAECTAGHDNGLAMTTNAGAVVAAISQGNCPQREDALKIGPAPVCPESMVQW